MHSASFKQIRSLLTGGTSKIPHNLVRIARELGSDTFRLGNIVFTGDSTISQEVLLSPDFERAFTEALAGLFGKGIINMEGSEHLAVKRTLANLTTGKDRYAYFSQVMQREAQTHVRSLEVGVNSIKSPIQDFTLDVLLNCLFRNISDTEVSILRNSLPAMVKGNTYSILKYFAQQTGLGPINLGPLIEILMYRQAKSLKTNRGATVRVIEGLIAAATTQLASEEHVGLDALSLMLKADMDKTEAIDNSISMFIAGYDTVAATLTVLLSLIANNPKKQEAIYSEVEAVTDGNYSFRSIPSLKPLWGITLGLFAPAFLNPRVAVRDTHISGIGEIKEGEQVMVSSFLSGWVSEVAHAPVFDVTVDDVSPRFIEEVLKTGLAFGSGSKRCIGFEFANMEVPIFIAELLKKYKVMPATKLEMGFIGVLEPTPEFKVSLDPR